MCLHFTYPQVLRAILSLSAVQSKTLNPPSPHATSPQLDRKEVLERGLLDCQSFSLFKKYRVCLDPNANPRAQEWIVTKGFLSGAGIASGALASCSPASQSALSSSPQPSLPYPPDSPQPSLFYLPYPPFASSSYFTSDNINPRGHLECATGALLCISNVSYYLPANIQHWTHNMIFSRQQAI